MKLKIFTVFNKTIYIDEVQSIYNCYICKTNANCPVSKVLKLPIKEIMRRFSNSKHYCPKYTIEFRKLKSDEI